MSIEYLNSDERVRKYLDMAVKISIDQCETQGGVKEESYEGYLRNVIEIAKMIQIEERG